MGKKSKKKSTNGNKAKGLLTLLMIIAALLFYVIEISEVEVDVPSAVEELVEEKMK